MMQGLADGYFVLPYTIGHYFASRSRRRSPLARGIQEDREQVSTFTSDCSFHQGQAHALSLHRELGKLLWESAAWHAPRRAQEALKRIPELRDDFWKTLNVTGDAMGF